MKKSHTAIFVGSAFLIALGVVVVYCASHRILGAQAQIMGTLAALGVAGLTWGCCLRIKPAT